MNAAASAGIDGKPPVISVLPVVDLAGTFSTDPREGELAARQLRAAGLTTGMSYLQNHGIAPSLIAEHFAFARAFFALPDGEKGAIDVCRSNCFRGYEALGSQTIDAATPGDCKEGFIMGPDLAPDHPHVRAGYPNTGTNLWPQRPVGFRAHMETYVATMNDLGCRLARVLAASLDVPQTYFDRALVEPLTYSQLLHYPAVPDRPGTRWLGAGAHVDWGLFTILLQDEIGGLEFLGADARWYAVPPVEGTFVLIFGEMVLRLTDGRYRSAMHRVTENRSGRSRFSMPTFFDPDYDYRVECVPTCAPDAGASSYATCSVGEHMLAMARATLSAPPPLVAASG